MIIRCGDYEVLESGSVTALKDCPLEFIFPADSGIGHFKIVFADDPAYDGPAVNVERAQTCITIHMVNANNAFGGCPDEPFELCEYNGRRLFFTFRIYASASTKEKLLHYTWLLL